MSSSGASDRERGVRSWGVEGTPASRVRARFPVFPPPSLSDECADGTKLTREQIAKKNMWQFLNEEAPAPLLAEKQELCLNYKIYLKVAPLSGQLKSFYSIAENTFWIYGLVVCVCLCGHTHTHIYTHIHM